MSALEDACRRIGGMYSQNGNKQECKLPHGDEITQDGEYVTIAIVGDDGKPRASVFGEEISVEDTQDGKVAIVNLEAASVVLARDFKTFVGEA